jgi:tyrosyl-tRNA synthetase
MGKTENGAVWLDPEKTSPYDFYQYWRNVNDADVRKCLCLLTFLPMDEINMLCEAEGAAINRAKEKLAYEVTKIVHGEEEAQKADTAAKAAFSGKGAMGSLPTSDLSRTVLENGVDIISLLVDHTSLVPSRSEARRLIQQKGIKIEGTAIENLDYTLNLNNTPTESFMIQKGKKVFHQVNII